jgi:hypothetical protein
MNKIDDFPDAKLRKEQFMILSDCTSPWYSNVYVSVATANVEGVTVEKISGDFLAKAFEGDYSNIGKWVKEVEKLLPAVRESIDEKKDSVEKCKGAKFYFYYPTCPKSKKWEESCSHPSIFVVFVTIISLCLVSALRLTTAWHYIVYCLVLYSSIVNCSAKMHEHHHPALQTS